MPNQIEKRVAALIGCAKIDALEVVAEHYRKEDHRLERSAALATGRSKYDLLACARYARSQERHWRLVITGLKEANNGEATET